MNEFAPGSERCTHRLTRRTPTAYHRAMDYVFLGGTGIRVSELCFGTMSFGGDADEATSALLYARCREAGVNFFRQIMPLTMMSWSNPGPNGIPEVLTQPNTPPLRALRRLSAYFEAEIRLGRLRPFDPEILARIFLGGVQQYVFFELVTKAQHALPMPLPTFLRGLIAVLWDGASPQPADAAQLRRVP